ncbi:hypothetical protein QEP66_00800 [Streptomyces sp. LB8]|uniref:hypothetical protein n=1 Tax=Streptomyces sp. LB8 TaxID=3042509 RepID=UPI00264824A1|nr:hypothetical protein [Streptomyces sp. LB8]MDN5380671.1 hypothetical protein [Streptomyces sp. LB8]
MRIRRLLTAVVATAAFTGLGLTGVATATNGDGASLTPGECTAAGGTIDWSTSPLPTCRGGSLDGREID